MAEVQVADPASLYSETPTDENPAEQNGDDLAEEVSAGTAAASDSAPAEASTLDEEDESDDEEVNVIVRTGTNAMTPSSTSPAAASASANSKSSSTAYQAKPVASAAQVASKQTKSIDLNAPGNIQGVPTTDFNLTSLPDSEKPWKQPGADSTDYFNYGFHEESWVQYAEKQRNIRNQYGQAPQMNVPTRMPPVMYNRPRAPYVPMYRPRLQPEVASGAISVLGSTGSIRPPPGAGPVPGFMGPPPDYPFPGAPGFNMPPPGFAGANPFAFPPPMAGVIPGHPGFPGGWPPGVFPPGGPGPMPVGIERPSSPASMRSDEADFPEMVAAPPPDGVEHSEPNRSSPQPIGYPGGPPPQMHPMHHRDHRERRHRPGSPRELPSVRRDYEREARHRRSRSRSRSPGRSERRRRERSRERDGSRRRKRSPDEGKPPHRSSRSKRPAPDPADPESGPQ